MDKSFTSSSTLIVILVLFLQTCAKNMSFWW